MIIVEHPTENVKRKTAIRAGYDFCLLPISNFSVSSIISGLCNEN